MLFIYPMLAAYAVAYLYYRGPEAWREAWAWATAADKEGLQLNRWIVNLGGAVGSLAIIWLLFMKVKNVVGNPLQIDLQKYLRVPDYESRVAFIERFHIDFADIAMAYTEGRRLCVFIDDIDRCEPAKSADLMQAINMMIPQCKNLVFVIGMDREKVAAAVAVKQEKILPYLAPSASPSGQGTSGVNRTAGLDYGHAFIEKFIQIAFRVPQTDRTGIGTLLDGLFGDKKPEAVLRAKTPPWEKALVNILVSLGQRHERTSVAPATVPSAQPKSNRIKESLRNEERDITLMVAPVLECNPRRAKQFINSFRLNAYIANMTEILHLPLTPPPNEKLTLPQIGKFVAITLRWPLFLSDLEQDSRLLADLERKAIRDRSGTPERWDGIEPRLSEERMREGVFVRWNSERGLMDFLWESCRQNLPDSRFRFQTIKPELLLRVSPHRKPPSKIPEARGPDQGGSSR
jgi:hypothetical protein